MRDGVVESVAQVALVAIAAAAVVVVPLVAALGRRRRPKLTRAVGDTRVPGELRLQQAQAEDALNGVVVVVE